MSLPPMGVTIYGRPQGSSNPYAAASLELTVHHPGGGRAVHRVSLWDHGDQLAHDTVHNGDRTARGMLADWVDENHEHFQAVPAEYKPYIGQLIRRGHRYPPEPPTPHDGIAPDAPAPPVHPDEIDHNAPMRPRMSRRAVVTPVVPSTRASAALAHRRYEREKERPVRVAKAKMEVRRYTFDERSGFERAIDANPHDTLAHGAYADWLDDNGHHDEARFRRAMGEWIGRGVHEHLRGRPAEIASHGANYDHPARPEKWLIEEGQEGPGGFRVGPRTLPPGEAFNPTTIEEERDHLADPNRGWRWDYGNHSWPTYRSMEHDLRHGFMDHVAPQTPPPDTSPDSVDHNATRLSRRSAVRRYSATEGDVNNLLHQITTNPEHQRAGSNLRGVAADALQEQGREAEANVLRSHPHTVHVAAGRVFREYPLPQSHRTTALAWHGGGGSALYGIGSTGRVNGYTARRALEEMNQVHNDTGENTGFDEPGTRQPFGRLYDHLSRIERETVDEGHNEEPERLSRTSRRVAVVPSSPKRYAAYRVPAGGGVNRGTSQTGGQFGPDMTGAFMNPPAVAPSPYVKGGKHAAHPPIKKSEAEGGDGGSAPTDDRGPPDSVTPRMVDDGRAERVARWRARWRKLQNRS